MHGDERGTSSKLPEGDVEIRKREVVTGVADHDRGDGLGPGVRLRRRNEVLAVPLPLRIRRGKDEQGRAWVVSGRVAGGRVRL